MLAIGMILLAACGPSRHTAEVAAGAGGAGSAQTTAKITTPAVDVEVTGHGENTDDEPTPRGTIRIDGRPSRFIWVQAIAREDHDQLTDQGYVDGQPTALGLGASRTTYTSGDQYRVASSDGSVQPDEVAAEIFDLNMLPAGMHFLPASVAASMALDADPSEEPIGVFPTGVTTLRITVDGTTYVATKAAAEPGSLVGLLLIDRREITPGIWSGSIAPGHRVVLLEDHRGHSVVVVHQPASVPPLVDARQQILDQVAGV